MITLQQARNAKLSLTSTTKDLPVSIGIAHDNHGYYLKVYLSELVNHNIPSEIDVVRVVIEVTGLPRSY